MSADRGMELAANVKDRLGEPDYVQSNSGTMRRLTATLMDPECRKVDNDNRGCDLEQPFQLPISAVEGLHWLPLLEEQPLEVRSLTFSATIRHTRLLIRLANGILPASRPRHQECLHREFTISSTLAPARRGASLRYYTENDPRNRTRRDRTTSPMTLSPGPRSHDDLSIS